MKATTGARWAFGAALVTLPWVGWGVVRCATGQDLGAGLQPSWFFLALATLLSVPAWRRGTWPRGWLMFLGAASAALGLSALGLTIAPSGEAAAVVWSRFARQLVQTGIMVAFLVWPALWVRGPERWRWTARLLVVGACGQAIYGGLQYLDWHLPTALLPVLEKVFTSNPAILSGSEQLHVGDGFRDMPRLRGTMCEPLYLGNFLLMTIPLVALTGWPRLLRRFVTVALLLVLILTWSRGAWLAGVGALLLAAVLGFAGNRPRPTVDRRRLLGLGAGLAMLVVVLLLTLGPERLGLPWERLAQSLSSRDWSNLTRLYSVQAAWRAFLLSPVVGIGWGQFAFHFPALVDPMGLQSQFTWPVVNSFPLRVLCETGLVGFGVAMAGVGALALGAVRILADGATTPDRARVVGAAAIAAAGVGIQLAVFSQYNLPHIWIAWGLLLAALADRDLDAPKGDL